MKENVSKKFYESKLECQHKEQAKSLLRSSYRAVTAIFLLKETNLSVKTSNTNFFESSFEKLFPHGPKHSDL